MFAVKIHRRRREREALFLPFSCEVSAGVRRST
jgi:hypothetical protein